MKKEWRWLVGFIIPPSCTIRICNLKLKKSTLKTGYATGLKIQRIQELGLQIPVAVRNFINLKRKAYPRGRDRGEVENIKTRRTNSQLYIQNNIYTYFEKTGNLYTRSDLKNRRSEEFAYDDLNRLTKAWLNGELIHDMTYHPNGNIDTKSDVGTYRYDTPRPHAMSGIDNVGEGVTNEKQFIEYSTFNKVSQIRQGIRENNISKLYNIYYGLDEQRIKTVYSPNFNTALTRYYFGSYEKEIDGDGNVTHIDYIYSPTGLSLIVKNGTKYYTHTDLLGSIERITSATGSLVSEYAYTPWGGRILLSGVNITDRGYTGHEHLTPFGDDTNGGFCLINMNGRIYDPVLARFLSPDPYVQAPDFTQSFNRYAYCINNPFKYTDPSGEFFFTTLAAIFCPPLLLPAIFVDFFTEFGYDVQKYTSPIALHVDINANTHKQGIGLQASVGIPQMYGLSARAHGGIAYNWKNYDITPGWETNYGYELGVFGFINVGETHFNSPGTKFDQTLAHATIGVPGLNIKYYNDWFFDSPLGDGGDRYRTGAGQITIGPIKIGYYMFTGDPGLDKNDRIKDMNQGGKGGLYLTGKNGENPDEFRAGVSYIGIGPFRFGKDRERTRHELQNVLIHDKLLAKNPSPWFRPLWDRPDKWYWGFFGGGMLW